MKVKNDSKGTHLNNLSYAGPMIMGVGGKSNKNTKYLPS